MGKMKAFCVLSAVLAATAAIGGSRKIPYDGTIRDRLWMWGHNPYLANVIHEQLSAKGDSTLDAIEARPNIEMADACRYMGIWNVCSIMFRDMDYELEDYCKTLRGMKRVAWGVSDGDTTKTKEEKKRLADRASRILPNLTTLYLDDYFCSDVSRYTLDEINELRGRQRLRGTDLAVVLYLDQNGVKEEYRAELERCETISLWMWEAKNLAKAEEGVRKCRAMVGPKKEILLGLYMWDFGGGDKPIPPNVMKSQLEVAYKLLKERAIDGLIFHCTPFVAFDLEAVKISRAWIAQHGDERLTPPEPGVTVRGTGSAAEEDFGTIRRRYEKELLERIVPFWERHSIDRECGGYLTCLDREGKPYDTFKEMWLEWREVYMFARLYNSEYSKPDWLKIAADGYAFLVAKARRADGSYVYRLDRRGGTLMESGGGADVFTHGFAAMAAAELYKATKDEKCRAEALSCWKVYRRLWEANDRPYRQLAHRMIGLNVLNVFQGAFGDTYLKEATGVFAEIRGFFDSGTGCLLERARPDGTFDLETQYGRFVNPGHVAEGCSFVCDHFRRGGDRAELPFVKRMLRRHFAFGWDRERGGGFVYRDAKGLPCDKTDWMLKSWWACCEAATAALRVYELTGESEFLAMFREIDAYNWREFRDPDYPEWYAYAPVEGRRAHTYKGNFRKGCFHLPRHLLDCIEVLKRLEGRRSHLQ